MKSINPATEQVIAEYDEHSDEEVQKTLQQSHQAFEEHRDTSFEERAEWLKRAAGLLREQTTDLAKIITDEMGKLAHEAKAEVQKCALVCDYYADNGARFLQPEGVPTEAAHSRVQFDPLGPVFAVMPWNFPFWQVFRFAAPALMAGNSCLLKHASNVTGCALAIERVLQQSGMPAGLFRTLLISASRADSVIEDVRVRAATLTGSDRAGRSVAASAGRNLKKTVLELGGSDPFIVLADADLASAVRTAVQSRTLNCGQSCIAAKRFLVQESVAQPFVDAFVRQMAELRTGPPDEDTTHLAPLAREDLRRQLHTQVTLSIESGAQLLLGGKIPDARGWYYPATVLDHVSPGCPAFDEETFGPVAAIMRVRDADHAIELANQSSFGLGAGLWTSSRETAEHVANHLQSGCVFVNSLVRSDPRVPFGGVKDSGYGRELSHFGIREFVNIKTVWMESIDGQN